MLRAGTIRGPSDRTLNRLILGAVVALVIGAPLVGVLYFLDRHVDAGPSMIQRSISGSEEAVRKNPNQIGARMQLALAYLATGRYADAITQYDEVLKVAPDNRAAMLARAQANAVSGNLARARPDFERIVNAAKDEEMANVDPQLEASYYGLGTIALAESRPTDAVAMLEKAIAINRTDADALAALGKALVATGDANGAVGVLRRAIALVPSGWKDPYASLAGAYAALGDQDGAAYATAMVAFTEKRLEAAKAGLEPLSAGGRFRVDALIGLGLVAEQRGDSAAAAGYYQRVLSIDANNFGAITGLNRLGDAGDGRSISPSPTSISGGN